MKTKISIFLVVILLSGSFSVQPAYSFEKDTHYYWTFFLALCLSFSWEEAHLIASGNWRMDKTDLVAGPFDSDNGDWHALGDPEKVKAREKELWQRVLDEKDPKKQLIKLGQYLHFRQDMFSHEGYTSEGVGHGLDGHRPDSPGHERHEFREATKATLDALKDKLTHLGRTPQDHCNFEKDLKPIMDEIIDQSKPGFWGNHGQEKNRKTIERAIKKLLFAKIPDDAEWRRDDRPLIPDTIEGDFRGGEGRRGEPRDGTWALGRTEQEIKFTHIQSDDKTHHLTVRNNGQVPIFSIVIENPDGNLQLVEKIAGWNVEPLSDNEVMIITEDDPIGKGETRTISLVSESIISELDWQVSNDFYHMIDFGVIDLSEQIPSRVVAGVSGTLQINTTQLIPTPYQLAKLEISGFIDGYERGTDIVLEVISDKETDDNKIDKIKILATSEGYFHTEIFVDETWERGNYLIILKYGESEIETKKFVVRGNLPAWIKNNAKWWSDEQISDKEFATAIGYLIKEGIILVPGLTTEPELFQISESVVIPQWIKNNAKWWSEDIITENDFVSGIKFMVENKIIDLNPPPISLTFSEFGISSEMQPLLFEVDLIPSDVRVEISKGGQDWIEIAKNDNLEKINSPYLGDVWLLEWDTSKFSAGTYQIRTMVTLTDGKIMTTEFPVEISFNPAVSPTIPFLASKDGTGSCKQPPQPSGVPEPTEHALKKAFLEATNQLEDCEVVEVTIYVDQPARGERELISGDDVGHTFIEIKCGDKILTLGFYPDGGLSYGEVLGNSKKKGKIHDDTGHPWDTKKTWNVPKQNATRILDFINNFDTTYQLQGNNCSDFAKGAAKAGGINVPEGDDTEWPWPIGGHGTNPGDLGEDLIEEGGERNPNSR